jgi:Ger(x)C family germination protein
VDGQPTAASDPKEESDVKHWCHAILVCLLLLTLTGCGDQLYLENTDIPLSVGLDMDDEGKIIVVSSAPVFNEEANKKTHFEQSTALSFRQNRKLLNSQSQGNVIAGKIQNLIISKQMLKRINAFPILDVIFRDPKSEINARALVVDGSLEDLQNISMEDKGRLGIAIRDTIDAAHQVSSTVLTRVIDFRGQMLDNRVTPYLTEMRIRGQDYAITGTALLNKDGKYATSLDQNESSLLLLLQHQTEYPLQLPFTAPLQLPFTTPPNMAPSDPTMSQMNVSLTINRYKISSDYAQGRFHFEFQVDLTANLSERTFPFDMKTERRKLEQVIEKQLQQKLERLIAKIQHHRLDPMGLGRVAQAYHYPIWKQVQNNWPETLAKADIRVTPHVTIKSYGITF